MLHQERPLASNAHDFAQVPGENLSMLAYRSLAESKPTDSALQQLLHVSQRRNRAAGLTGVLVYDRGAYFQWLEGPAASLQRVWGAIKHDPRHYQVTVLRDEPISTRVFRGWDLRMASGAKVSVDAAIAAMESSSAHLRHVMGRPQSSIEISLEDVFARIVIPRLLEVHGRDGCRAAQSTLTESIWHAEAHCGTKLARVLLSPRATESSYFVDSLLKQGANFNALYKEVFEPAQLRLGQLCDQDLCDDFHLTVALARLQIEIRRVNAALPSEHLCKPMHNVLLSAQSDEPHRVGLIMSSEVFERSGWYVDCSFPADDQALNSVLRSHWFDVLKLSQSGALRRDHRLKSIRETIDEARAASMNPGLIVMVDGRTFVEQPQIYRAVHANAMSVSALDAAPIAERLLDTSRTETPVCLASAS